MLDGLAELAGAHHRGEAQGAQRLVRRGGVRREIGDDQRLAVARQTGLQRNSTNNVSLQLRWYLFVLLYS